MIGMEAVLINLILATSSVSVNKKLEISYISFNGDVSSFYYGIITISISDNVKQSPVAKDPKIFNSALNLDFIYFVILSTISLRYAF